MLQGGRHTLIQDTPVLQAEEAKESTLVAFKHINRLVTRLQPDVGPFSCLPIDTHQETMAARQSCAVQPWSFPSNLTHTKVRYLRGGPVHQ